MQKRSNAVTDYARQILNQVRQFVVGKDDVLLWVVAAILAKGHILLEDVPGVGKTTMALAFSKVLNLEYSRVQFTPDVLPSDVTGYSIPDQRTGEMVYQKGAVLCNLFLADELNRATSRTQSALLGAMEEGQITVDGISHPLPQPFLVIATQNPTGAAGTQLPPNLTQHLARSWRPKPGGGYAENHEIRQYHPGDNLNQIHWKLSAKVGDLMLREAMEPERGLMLLTMDLCGTPEKLDIQFGRLLWLSNWLLENSIPFEVRVLTGNGIETWAVPDAWSLQKCIEALLCAPYAKEGSIRDRSFAAAWQHHIGGEPDEA
jgi:hypothetical protein